MQSHRYCPGCGHVRVSQIVEEKLIKERGILIGTVGCSVALPDLFETIDAVSAAHGRGLSVGTALRRCLPNVPLIIYGGDGDLTTIGIGELVNTILRNEKLVCVLINNKIFGMTGFQMSSQTNLGAKTKTTVNGRDESYHGIPLNVKFLMKLNPKVHYYLTHAASKDGINLFKEQLNEAMEYDGFSLIEVISPCVTLYGNAKIAYENALKQYEQKFEEEEHYCICKDGCDN